MHMVGANLCEWLYVLVEETKHEIIHLGEGHNSTNSSLQAKYCQEGQIMGSLVRNASPFLFPCTIEYSLICAVILFEMWKKVKSVEVKEAEKAGHKEEKVATHYTFSKYQKLKESYFKIIELSAQNAKIAILKVLLRLRVT